MKLNAFHCDINTKSTFIVLKDYNKISKFHVQFFVQ